MVLRAFGSNTCLTIVMLMKHILILCGSFVARKLNLSLMSQKRMIPVNVSAAFSKLFGIVGQIGLSSGITYKLYGL